MPLVFDSLFTEFMTDGKEPSDPTNPDGKAEPSKHLTETAKPRDEPNEPNEPKPDDKTTEEITNLHNSISELTKGFEELKKVISEQQKIIEEKGEQNNGDNQE